MERKKDLEIAESRIAGEHIFCNNADATVHLEYSNCQLLTLAEKAALEAQRKCLLQLQKEVSEKSALFSEMEVSLRVRILFSKITHLLIMPLPFRLLITKP